MSLSAPSSRFALEEQYGDQKTKYHLTLASHQGESHQLHRQEKNTVKFNLVALFRSLFLPLHYPSSVTSDYLEFQMWDTIQAMCSYLRGMLCTQAVLIGLGVGEATASATNAALNWLLRDGMGMLGGLLFAWCGSQSFGSNLRPWRLFADVINDVGQTLDLISPLLPREYFLAMLSAGCLCRSMCGVSAGATRAALMQHFAKQNNVADLSAKEGIQETFVTLLGMVGGWFLMTWIDGSTKETWILFLVLTGVHIYANWRGVSCLILTTLNSQRAHIVIEEFLEGVDDHKTRVLTPRELAKDREQLVWLDSNMSPIILGVAAHSVVEDQETMKRLLDVHDAVVVNNDPEKRNFYPYLVAPSFTDTNPSALIPVILHAEATPLQILQALFHAHVYRRKAQQHQESPDNVDVNIFVRLWRQLSIWRNSNGKLHGPPIDQNLPQFQHQVSKDLTQSLEFTKYYFPLFVQLIEERGWNLDHILISTYEWRCSGAGMIKNQTVPRGRKSSAAALADASAAAVATPARSGSSSSHKREASASRKSKPKKRATPSSSTKKQKSS